MRLTIAKLHETATLRFPDDPARRQAYIDDVLGVSRVDGDTYEIEPATFAALREKYGPRPRLRQTP